MASKNVTKIYVENSFYHMYNRGVERRNIFVDEQDYSVFLSYLENYLNPKDIALLEKVIASSTSTSSEKDKALKLLRLKNYSDEMKLLSHALLPNHFHLLIRQSKNVMQSFMNSLGTRYGMYFNRKYRRNGVLFQDAYKAVLIESDEQLLHLTRYIHLNATAWLGLSPQLWRDAPFPSSLSEYLGLRKTVWIHPEYVLPYFSRTNPQLSYEEFIGLSPDVSSIVDLTID